MKERLQKLISASGVVSRRNAEVLIQEGKVTVNGEVANLGDKADLLVDEVCVNGTVISKPASYTYLMLNKPRGFLSTVLDDRGRKSVCQLVRDCGVRVWPVGRLDMDSEGLLFLTDDGAFTQKMTHPSHTVEKEYLVWVLGNTTQAIPILSSPMELDGKQIAPAQVRCGKKTGAVTQLSIIIKQGMNRQVRRMCEKAGLSVMRLKRVRQGDIWLDRALKPGQYRHVSKEEIEILLSE